MPADLAPVYLDDTRVTLQGDPRPKVAKILLAGGRPTDARVVRVEGQSSERVLSPDEVIDRTGNPAQPVHLRTTVASTAPLAPASSSEPGKVQAPGDILRGTDAPAQPEPSEESARAGRNPPAARRFAESQSFADPVHKGGSPRVARDTRPSRPAPTGHVPDGGLSTQETGSKEGAHTPRRPSTTSTSRASLHRASEEE